MKKITYVGDNRNRHNWGCRATSISLHQILSSQFIVETIISGKYIAFDSNAQVGISKVLPPHLYNRLLRKKRKRLLDQMFLEVERILGARADYISEDPHQSAKEILNNRQSDPVLSYIYESIIKTEEIIINGEGGFIFTTPTRRDLLFFLTIIELANQLGRRVHVVNSIFSDCPISGRNKKTFDTAIEYLNKCASVIVRDPTSYDILTKESPGITCMYVPDSLFSWHKYTTSPAFSPPKNGDMLIPFPEDDSLFGSFDFSQPYVCIAGSSLRTTKPYLDLVTEEQLIRAYEALTNEIKHRLNMKVYLVQTCFGDAFLKKVSQRSETPLIPVNIPIVAAVAILSRAQLFISGRYHPSIMAALGGTPCVFLESNSHKTLSLQRVLEYDSPQTFSLVQTEEEREAILSLAIRLTEEGRFRREKILGVVGDRCYQAVDLPRHIDQ